MGGSNFWVDDAAHLLYFGGRAFPCDREIAAARPWHGYALLLSADTDCLSLWDEDGLIRTARAGVFPQDMILHADSVYICGGADGKLHRLHLPSLRETAEYPLPGMPERVCAQESAAFVLTLLPEEPVSTALLQVHLHTGQSQEIARFAGIPGALAADMKGLWVGVTEQALHFPWGTSVPDMCIEGVSLPDRITVTPNGIVITDSLEGQQLYIRCPQA